MATRFKVWTEIEEYDEDTDEQVDLFEPYSCATFDTLEEAEGFVERVKGVRVNEDYTVVGTRADGSFFVECVVASDKYGAIRKAKETWPDLSPETCVFQGHHRLAGPEDRPDA